MIITKQTNVSLIYVPIHYGGGHSGASLGPAAVKATNLNKLLNFQGITVVGEVDIEVPSVEDINIKNPKLRYLDQIVQVCNSVALATQKALEQGSFPVIIGGDHSFAIGSIAGASNFYRKQNKELGLIWFDAHGDMNTQETSLSGNIHGMPLAKTVGFGDSNLTQIYGYKPKVKSENTVLIGLRDVDEEEKKIIKKSEIISYTMSDIDHIGINEILEKSVKALNQNVEAIHVSFDLDVIDPQYAPGVSTPVDGGINFRESMQIMSYLAQYGKICSLDIAELNPLNDIKNKTGELACNLILTCLGKNML